MEKNAKLYEEVSAEVEPAIKLSREVIEDLKDDQRGHRRWEKHRRDDKYAHESIFFDEGKGRRKGKRISERIKEILEGKRCRRLQRGIVYKLWMQKKR